LHGGRGARAGLYAVRRPTPPTRAGARGRPDWAACAALAGGLINASADCGRPPCALGAPQPPTRGRFHALTGFFVVWHFFGLAPGAGLGALEAAGRRHCAAGWAALQAARGGETHMDQYCFRCAAAPSLGERRGFSWVLNLPQTAGRCMAGRCMPMRCSGFERYMSTLAERCAPLGRGAVVGRA